ncbi:NADH dehydrogenase [ubiquinone] 1 beta subcomplex subunit 2, mitochondrial-like [Odontomachus brunneus]|uniref:NADH dehydrogenase [ubiquinone] 1 beta subcomplex subunit 2, mitochondrial-like n=1 Tax=Odontomachus brunneus TaxID=486640 RepID=UPI0013F25E58|nr:NADH dehydrogenase [ubiquinone] 1 beta subcomplex subunit 2, mitochondrial-like [Odontomachus brunneus]
MILSRGLNVLKIAYKTNQNKVAAINLQSVRSCHDLPWAYRSICPMQKNYLYAAEAFGGFMWWWILWHFWHDFDHIVGEFPYPETDKWTDEELGIPPDDYDGTTM